MLTSWFVPELLVRQAPLARLYIAQLMFLQQVTLTGREGNGKAREEGGGGCWTDVIRCMYLRCELWPGASNAPNESPGVAVVRGR